MEKKLLEAHLRSHQKWLNDSAEGIKLDLRDAYIRDANLQGANLRGSNLQGVYFRDANLRYANLQDANLRYANLQGVDLRYAKFQYVDLRDANLRGADLRGVDLRGGNLWGSNLRGADLRGADLDFSVLNLSCGGLNFKIDERQAKQLMYHVINLMQYSEIDTSKVVKKHVYKWLEDSHLVTKHGMPILKEVE